MSTKAEERAALAKIRKIAEALGENSYVQTAVAGAFALAEQNIEDDAAYTVEFYIDAYNGIADAEREHREELQKLQKEIEDLRRSNGILHQDIENIKDDRDAWHDELCKERAASAAKAGQIADLEVTVVRLKAAIYDLEHEEGAA